MKLTDLITFWKKSAIILLLALGVPMLMSSQTKVPFKTDVQINLDGQITSREWRGAKTIKVNNKTRILVLQDGQNLYLAVKGGKKMVRYVDLYLKQDTLPYNLHASMQLGERILTGNWNDTIPRWKWGNNKDWMANTAKIKAHKDDAPLSEVLVPREGVEFQISKEKIAANDFLLRVEFRDFMGIVSDIVYPKGSSRKVTKNWLWLVLE